MGIQLYDVLQFTVPMPQCRTKLLLHAADDTRDRIFRGHFLARFDDELVAEHAPCSDQYDQNQSQQPDPVELLRQRSAQKLRDQAPEPVPVGGAVLGCYHWADRQLSWVLNQLNSLSGLKGLTK